MATANEAVFRAMYDALFAGRLDELQQFVADDFEIHEATTLPYGGVYRGPEGLRACFAAVSETWQNFSVAIEDLGSWDDKVVFVGTMSGIANGHEFTLPLMELWQYRDGKAILNRPHYWDTKLLVDMLAG